MLASVSVYVYVCLCVAVWWVGLEEGDCGIEVDLIDGFFARSEWVWGFVPRAGAVEIGRLMLNSEGLGE